MFTRVTIFAAVVIAVSAQDHYAQGHATSSQSIIRHGEVLNNHGYQTLAAPISYPSIHTIPTSYLRPAIQIPITNNAIHATPIASTSAITYAAPVTLHAPLHTPTITHHSPITQQVPLHTAAFTHASPITHRVPLHTAAITHASPITHQLPLHTAAITHASPITHQLPLHTASITHANPITHHAPLIHAAPTQYYAPIHQHIAPFTHHTSPVALQYAPGRYNQYQHTSEHQDYQTYPRYQFEYSVHDSHTGDIKSQHEERDGDVLNGVYSLHEADGSVRTVRYNSHGHNGFNAEVHHSQPSAHTQPTTQYAPSYYRH